MIPKAANEIIKIDKQSEVPLFGVDFLGILDRGTNVLEIKPNTICNLHCKYCFVSAGDYTKNFVTDTDYLIEWIEKAIEIKQCNDIEIHLAAYGEIMLYKDLYNLIARLRKNPNVNVISAQSNGLLLTEEKIKKLEEAGLTRLNLSLNSMDPERCAYYCGVKHYNLDHLLKMFDAVLASSIELLVAPVWFRGVNNEGIMNIIEYIKQKQAEGYEWPKLRLGIQNYLTYKTGRKIGKARMRDFGFFYKTLRNMEKEHGLKLKLGPKDFGIHKTIGIVPPVRLNDVISVEILMKGRYDNEYITRYDKNWAVKVLIGKNQILKKGQHVKIKLIRGNLRGNLLTGIPTARF